MRATTRRLLWTATVTATLPGALGSAAWALRWDGPSPVVALQAGMPFWVPASLLALILAATLRSVAALTLSATTLTAVVALVAPAAVTVAAPPDPASPRLTVVAANVYYRNDDPEAAARALLAQGADVVAISEYTPRFRAAAEATGLWTAYPYKVRRAQDSASGAAVFSRLPFDGEPEIITFDSNTQIRARIRVDNALVTVLAVHPHAPGIGRTAVWRDHGRRLVELADSTAGPALAIGDFNSTRWNGTLRRLLERGWSDAGAAVGLGLTMSWPSGLPLPRFARLDHALVKGGVTTVSVHDVTVPGADHTGLRATIALPAAGGT